MGMSSVFSGEPTTSRINRPFDYFGENAFLFHKSHRLCRFLIEFAQANMLKRLSCEDGSVWMDLVDVGRLPGMCRDQFDRAVQFADLEALKLIERPQFRTGSGGLWNHGDVKISNIGLEAVRILKMEKYEGVMVVYSGGRPRALPATVDVFW